MRHARSSETTRVLLALQSHVGDMAFVSGYQHAKRSSTPGVLIAKRAYSAPNIRIGAFSYTETNELQERFVT